MACGQHAKILRSTRKNSACAPQLRRGAPGFGLHAADGAATDVPSPTVGAGARTIERSAPEGRRQRRGLGRQPRSDGRRVRMRLLAGMRRVRLRPAHRDEHAM